MRTSDCLHVAHSYSLNEVVQHARFRVDVVRVAKQNVLESGRSKLQHEFVRGERLSALALQLDVAASQHRLHKRLRAVV